MPFQNLFMFSHYIHPLQCFCVKNNVQSSDRAGRRDPGADGGQVERQLHENEKPEANRVAAAVVLPN